MPAWPPLLLRLFVLLFLLPYFCPVTCDELQVLLTVQSFFHNPDTRVFDSWDSSKNPTCNFTGIICDPISNLVKEIHLSDQNLTAGPSPVPFYAICQLKSLEKLFLGHNSLHGILTNDLNDCVNLKHLDLSDNRFSGSFPDISALSKLQFLYLNGSGFSGNFPWSSLGNMTDLIALSLGDNPFNRNPFPNEILKLTTLRFLYLSNCSLEGIIPPRIGNLTNLVDLELSQNSFYGEIPIEITKLKYLWMLELYDNGLTGKFPIGMGNLSNLEFLDVSTNRLNGDLSEIRFLNRLKSLELFQNDFSGELPAEFGEFKQLMNFSVYRNKLTGQIPQNIGSWSDFNYIDASENYFTGMIPPNMCKKGAMTELLLLQNNLTGEIPPSYGDCVTLTRFRVSKNSLSGIVPNGIWGLPNAVIIDLAMNEFEGSITSDIEHAKFLAQLIVSDNKLSGALAPEISNASKLISLVLNNNRFSDRIPNTFRDLKQLGNLYLQSNIFSGSIPESLGSCESLYDINLANNSLTGTIPTSFGSLPVLTSLNLSDNKLSGPIPGSLSSLKLNLLDLSNNQLIGPIPVSLSIEAYNGSFAGNNGLCSQTIKPFKRCSEKSKPTTELHALLICLIILGISAMFFSVMCYIYLKKKKKKNHKYSWKEDSWDVKSFHVLSFSEDTILDAIKRDNLIGKGGSGNVYKVVLENGKELAVKHMWKNNDSTSPISSKSISKSPEFDAEVQTLSSIRHVNVVKLYCSITSEESSLLVYEYMPNGSLWDRLHFCKKLLLDWDQRYEIALGAARGLEYLHHGCDRPIIHRDVKSSNILLDESLKPRIADFGLAKTLQPNSSKDSSHVIAGTYGYIAPEYGYTNKINEKCDVYSFGVVLMELVTGKKPIEAEFGENKDIVNWISSKLESRETMISIMDSSAIILDADKEVAIKVLKTAILCTATLPALRPTMRNVVQMLEDTSLTNKVPTDIIICKDDHKPYEIL